MTADPQRLLRLGKAFAARAETLELHVLRLERLRQSRESDLAGLHRALVTPVVAALPLLVPSLRRIDRLLGEIAQLDHDIGAARKRLIEARARSELSSEIARARIAVSAGAREAEGLLEMITGFGQSSLRQDGGD